MDNPYLSKKELEDMRRDDQFRKERFNQWPELKHQCMTRNYAGVLKQIRCPNEATFTVGFSNGEAQNVCRACLIVVCETTKDEVVVMKLRRPDGTSNIRMP